MRTPSRIRFTALATAFAAAFVLMATGCEPPAGTDFLVDSTGDQADTNPGNGSCHTAANTCTLRAAIQEADANGQINDLVFVPGGTYDIATDLDITTSMFVTGSSINPVIIQPTGSQRAFTIGNGSGVDPIVSITHVTVQGASLDSTQPGAAVTIYPEASANLFDVVFRDNTAGITGGAIRNDGYLDLRRAEIRDNVIGGGATTGGGVTSTGAGIYNTGILKVADSTIAGNQSSRGGGIANIGGDADLTNVTISGNVVYEGGGGLYNTSVMGQTPGTAVVNVASSTITANEANHFAGSEKVRPWGGGVLNLSGGQINIGKSVVAENIDNRSDFSVDYSPDCYSVEDFRFTSHRANLVGILTDNCELRDTTFGDTGGIDFGTSDDPLDPELGSLTNNGGPTRTHAPLSGSPLVDTATSGSSATFFDCPDEDQRDIPRPLDGDVDGYARCDIGAVERTPTDDNDGVSSFVEDGAPNAGDGNADGIPDKWQPNVASLPTAVGDQPYVTFSVNGAGERIDQVNTVPNPDAATDPIRQFPIGYWNLDATTGADSSARVTVKLPPGITATQWWNHGPEAGIPANHWWNFSLSGTTGLSGFGGVLTLDFVDGGRGDRGGSVNGHVTDVGGAAKQLFCEMEPATIIGTNAGETINGTAGKDVIVALGGADTINGNGGDDVICGGGGNDTINGGTGADHLHGEDAMDTINGNEDGDRIYGEAGQDDLHGNAGADLLYGGDNDDELRGDAGIDTMDGGNDNDFLDGGTEDDTMHGGAGVDLLSGFDGNDHMFGDSGDDELYGNNGNDDLDGGPNFDILRGGPGSDTLINGEDTIS